VKERTRAGGQLVPEFQLLTIHFPPERGTAQGWHSNWARAAVVGGSIILR